MDNNIVIRVLTLYGNSLKKLYKFLPENCIKAIPSTTADTSKYDLEININGIIFTGKDDNSYIVICSFNKNYTKEELTSLQKIATKCFTYPFGDLGFSFALNIYSNNKTEKILRALLNKYKIEPILESLDSEGRIELKICDIRTFATPYFIDFILELQTLTNFLEEK